MRWTVFAVCILGALGCGLYTLYLAWQAGIFWPVFALGFMSNLLTQAAGGVIGRGRGW